MQRYIQTMHMQGRNHHQGEDSEDPDEEQEVDSGRPTGSHARGEMSHAKTYADIPHVGDGGLQPTMSASIFERLGGHGPRNRPQVSHQRVPSESPPRNRRERRAREVEARGDSDHQLYQPPQDTYKQPHHYGDDQQVQRPFLPVITESPKQTRSFEVDDNDENLPFSAGIRNAPIPHEFRVPKSMPYTGK
ncbi:hypothetical protein Adt_11446 [Abeliophyllum distichum]|uniref:Uncharacterized protein n=1 Tax=Abeliophyllum distichum TaxID=126358 RepID=A0ABD1UMV3_9LAMI